VTLEEFELLSQLTIVIPTANRPLALERSIEYWRDLPVTVHILDGSSRPFFSGEQLKDLPRITYHHFPETGNEGPWENYCRRIREASSLPLTKYSALCADDDAFTVSGLLGILTTLESDQTVDAMLGRTASYGMTKTMPTWRVMYSQIRDSKEFCSEDVSIRLGNPHSAPRLYYGIIRTDLWKHLFQISFHHTIFRTGKLASVVDKALCRIRLTESIVWLRQEPLPSHYFFRSNRRPNGRRPADWWITYLSVAQRLLSQNRFVERRKMCRQIVVAILFSTPNFGKLKAKRIARNCTRSVIFKGNFQLDLKKRKIIGQIIKWFSFVSPDIRRRITKALPERLSGALGYFERSPELSMATSRTDFLSFVSNVKNAGIRIVPDEIESFQRLLLKPREELRLRANI